MSIELAVFDLAGTTVDDMINGTPLVTVAMIEAFDKAGFEVTSSQVNQVRGMEKREAINQILLQMQSNILDSGVDKRHSLVDAIFHDFKVALDHHLISIDKEIDGTTNVFRDLSSKGIKIAVGSGFPQVVVENIVKKLNWGEFVDYVSSAEKEGKGRPDPALILSAMKHLNILDAKKVIKIGDTKVDIKEGKNAGCWTIAVLTGTQKEESLKEENPDFIIDNVKSVPKVISQIQDTMMTTMLHTG
eukprot:gene3333-3822_t